MVCATSKGSDKPAHTRSLIRAFASQLKTMNIKLLTIYYLEFLSLNGCCTGSSDFSLVKMPHCWKSHVTAHITTPNKTNLYGRFENYTRCILALVWLSDPYTISKSCYKFKLIRNYFGGTMPFCHYDSRDSSQNNLVVF